MKFGYGLVNGLERGSSWVYVVPERTGSLFSREGGGGRLWGKVSPPASLLFMGSGGKRQCKLHSLCLH